MAAKSGRSRRRDAPPPDSTPVAAAKGLAGCLLWVLGACVLVALLVVALSNLHRFSVPFVEAAYPPARHSRTLAAASGLVFCSAPWLLGSLPFLLLPSPDSRTGTAHQTLRITRILLMLALILFGVSLSFSARLPSPDGLPTTITGPPPPGFTTGYDLGYPMLLLWALAQLWAVGHWPEAPDNTLLTRVRALAPPMAVWLILTATAVVVEA